jgi:DNA-directed RNA polymerase I, II, and III subunit RPABC2
MSDDEDSYSDNNSVSSSSNSDTEIDDIPLFKPSIKIKSYGDEDEDEDEYDNKIGGAEEEDEIIEDESDNDIEIDETGEPIISKAIKPKKTQLVVQEDDADEDDNDEYDENYLHKFDSDIIKNYVNQFHPECLSHNYEEIIKLSIVIKNSDGIVIDPLHKTIPFLTKYEKARILGQRAKQIETGARPLVKVPENIIDSYIIAELELREKKIPFIIRRPIPGGACEYWKLHDLEFIDF